MAPTGSDSNPGTQAQPFRTIQKAANVVKAGESVIVKAGIYRERVTLKTSGTAGSPIIFQGEQGAIVDGGDRVTNWTSAGQGVYQAVMPYIPGNLTWNDKYVTWLNDSSTGQFWMDSNDSSWNGLEALAGGSGNTVYVRIRDRRNPNTENITVAPKDQGAFHIDGKSHNIVQGFTVRNAASAVLLTNNAADNTVEQNTLLGGSFTVGIWWGATRNHVRDNQITMDFIYPDIGNASASPRDQNIYTAFRAWGMIPSGVYIWQAGAANQVYRNDIFRHFAGVFNFVSTSPGLKVYENRIYNICGYALYSQGAAPESEWHDNLLYESLFKFRIDLLSQGPMYVYRNRTYDLTGPSNPDINFGGLQGWSGKLYIYHNSFSGSWAAITFWDQVNANIWLVNNVFSAQRFADFYGAGTPHSDRNWFGGDGAFAIGANDRAFPGQRLWNATNPSFTLTVNSSARSMGMDLSRSWSLNGTTHEALPGMNPGYFSGPRPDAGAVQHFGSP